ncbi:AAA family ATPase, partial [Bifidobacterium adolescentis]|uniref:AAA family ATPase n=1 Tax=Bifidobacterium adolescentis TaxID=1680 RepID=UPI003BB6E609
MLNSILSICKIHVNIGKFAEGADFQLFQENNGKKNSRVSLIFGRNGAGKSTIARQIVSLSSDDGNDKIFLDKDGNQIPLSPEEKTRIRVFDEQYVQEKILIKEKGLENIVMLGDQVLARKRIDEIDEKTIELGRQNVLLVQAKADLEEGTHSVEKIYQQAKEVAKDGGWTERYRQIEGGRPNLTPERWNRILSAQNDSSRQQLQEWGWCRFVGLVIDSITTNHATRPSPRRRSMM